MKLYMVIRGSLPSGVYHALDRARVGHYATTQEWQWSEGCAAVTVDSQGQVWVAVEYQGAVTVHGVQGLMSALKERGIDVSGATVDYGPVRPAKQEARPVRRNRASP